ncbi:MAG: peptidylprolyl isomerase [Elainellaceae cyanobacterium]
MVEVLKIGSRSVDADDILPLMAGYQMLPRFIQELVIDDAIAGTDCTAEEAQQARQSFYAQNKITDDASRQAWLAGYGMTAEQMDALALRELKIEAFKQKTWGPKLESYFLERKGKLDKVIYSLIRTKDIGIAQEIYFRILEGEQPLSELASKYSQGPEAQTDGLIGPVELSVPHPSLAKMLSVSQPGQLCPPTRVGEWVVIVRLERFVPAQLDDPMRERLLNECFQLWLQKETREHAGAALGTPAAPLSSQT